MIALLQFPFSGDIYGMSQSLGFDVSEFSVSQHGLNLHFIASFKVVHIL